MDTKRVKLSVAILGAVCLAAGISGCKDYSGAVRWDVEPGKQADPTACAEDEGIDLSAPSVQIRAPRNGEVINDPVYNGMKGVAHDVPADKTIVVFAADEYNFFLQYPFARHNRSTGVFEQKNIRIATEGDQWQLHVCLATRDAVNHLSSCARREQWDLPEFPEGVQLIESVSVGRRFP